eukprot:413323-Pleurochrysis_carterae.AAC.1
MRAVFARIGGRTKTLCGRLGATGLGGRKRRTIECANPHCSERLKWEKREEGRLKHGCSSRYEKCGERQRRDQNGGNA